MTEIINIILVAIIMFIVGWVARERYALKLIKSLREQLRQTLATSRHIPIKFTKDGDSFFVYNELTDEFLGQGKTRQEIQELLSTRFPGVYFTAGRDNLREVGLDPDVSV